jgi:hypothetical protein
MAVELKSGSGTDLATVGAVSKALRVTMYDDAGAPVLRNDPEEIAVSPVTVVNNDLITSLDVSRFKFFSLQLTGTWVGTVTFEESNDNGTFTEVVVQRAGDVLNPYGTSVTTNQLVKIPTLAKYLRVRVTSYTSGTVEGTCFGYKEQNDTGQISSTGEVTIAAGQSIGLDAGSSVALAAGTNDIGTVKVRPLITINPIYKKVISATGVNSTLVQAGASNLGILHIVNGAATARFFKLYNQATAPVVGTDIPMITITLAPGASNFTLPALVGIDFSLGLAFAILLGVEDSSTTPFTVSGEVTAMLAYT